MPVGDSSAVTKPGSLTSRRLRGLPIRRTNRRTIGQSEGIHVMTEFEFAANRSRKSIARSCE